MDSKTKNKQGFDSIKQMTNYVFGSKVNITSSSVSELGEGYFNVIYEIKVKNKEVLLKIAPPEKVDVLAYEKNMMQAEVEMLKLVRSATKVPVPGVYYYDESKKVCKVPYFFMEKMNGQSYNSVKDWLSKEEQYGIEYKIGQYNRQINEIEGTYFGYPGKPELQDSSWKNVFIKMVNTVLSDGLKNKVDIGIPYNKIEENINKLGYVLEEVKTPKLVHWDLWDGNVLIQDNEITGIIDFERALWADPLMEYYFKVAMDMDKPSGFMEGYGKTTFTENETKRRKLYNIYLYLIMIIECSYREYADDGQYNWAKGMLLKDLNN